MARRIARVDAMPLLNVGGGENQCSECPERGTGLDDGAKVAPTATASTPGKRIKWL